MDIQTLRSYRVAGTAIFDWATSFFVAALVGYLVLRLRSPIVWVAFIFFWIALGVVVHLALGIPTMFGYFLGLNARPERSPKNDAPPASAAAE